MYASLYMICVRFCCCWCGLCFSVKVSYARVCFMCRVHVLCIGGIYYVITARHDKQSYAYMTHCHCSAAAATMCCCCCLLLSVSNWSCFNCEHANPVFFLLASMYLELYNLQWRVCSDWIADSRTAAKTAGWPLIALSVDAWQRWAGSMSHLQLEPSEWLGGQAMLPLRQLNSTSRRLSIWRATLNR